MYGFSTPMIIHALTTYFFVGLTYWSADAWGAVTVIALELCDLQADSFVRGKRHLDSEEFCRLVLEEKYRKLNDFALCFCSLMGRTYVHVWLWKLVFHSELQKVEDAKSTWQPDVVSMYITCSDWNPSQWRIHGGHWGQSPHVRAP